MLNYSVLISKVIKSKYNIIISKFVVHYRSGIPQIKRQDLASLHLKVLSSPNSSRAEDIILGSTYMYTQRETRPKSDNREASEEQGLLNVCTCLSQHKLCKDYIHWSATMITCWEYW